MKGRKRLTAFILALLLVCLAAGPAENACAASLTELRSEVVELNDQLTLIKNINYNSSYEANAVEHYFEYTPGGNVLPLVCYGSGIKGAVSASRIFSEEAENGVTVAGLTNGDFFVMATGVSLGPVIRDGIIRTGGYSESIIAFQKDGTAKIGDPSLNIRLSFVDKDIHYGKLNFNKSITETNGICAYTPDFGETNSATLDTFNVFVRIMDGSSKVGDTIVGIVESSLEATGKTKLPENYLVLSIAKDTPYATALSQMQSLEPGEQVTLEFMVADDYLDTWQALGFEKWLVKGGQPVSDLDPYTPAPRTAFGLKPDGSYIVYTVDGRQAGYSAGLTYLDLAQRMAELGCVQAVNLDGGASTQLFAVYPGFDKQMQINRDSDANYLRSCANYVCFANFNEKTGVPAHLHVYPFDEYILCGTQLPVYAKATDSGWFTCAVPEDVTYSCDAMGSMEEDVYTAGSKPGTGIITASSGDLSGSMRVYLVADPDSITASVDDQQKKMLKAGLGKSYQLTAKSTWRGQELRSTQGCYTWSVEGDIGGGKTHILSLAKELAKDNDLRLVSFRRGVLSQEGMDMGIDTVDTGGNNGIFRSIRLAFEQAKAFKPDVIHCHGAKGNMMGILVKWFLRIPVMTTVHSDPELDYMGAPIRNLTNGNINRFCLRHMDYHVAVADRMRELLIQRGFDAQNIFAVYNGLDFSGSETGPRARKSEEETITVGIAARLNPVKDIATLLRAFAKAYAQDKRLRLSIAGSGEEEKSLKALAKELGIEDVTAFEGWISDIKEYFRGIDINVLSSLSETFPYSLLEGAYVHCPAIASNVGGIPYLIQNEKTGLLFEAGDSDAFADCILRLARDPQLRSQLAENLYEKARTEFSLERMKTDQEAIYRTLIHRSEMYKKGRYGAILCGAYGKGNAGDDAILRAILTSLKAIDPDMPFYVMSRNPVETSMKERVGSFYIFNLRKFFKYLHKTSLFVSGGGTLIQDVTSSRSLYFYLFTLLAAKWSGSRVVMYGCGIGPIRRGINRRWTGRVLNRAADIITLRDSISMELLQEIGVTKPEIILSADPTVNLPSVPDETVQEAFRLDGIPADARKIAFCLRDWDEFRSPEAVAEAADYAYERYGLLPVFLPMEYPRDVAVGEKVGAMVKAPHAVCSRRHSVEELRGMLSSMEVVCGMRLHSLIFASAGGSPIVGISYDVKVDSFIKDSGAKRCIQLKDLTAEALMADIDDAVAGGRSHGSETKHRLQTMELKNAEAARRLLSGKESA